ncbi:hypothetical protein VBD025_18160 [Virgibacillus flavescens]|uniref:hypothetical protein n=1 Tax=Virgibacillus flavescens TaxID=1611422 RepID=UPI003D33EE98
MYENIVAKILFIVGVVQITIGLLGGVIFGAAGMDYGNTFNWGLFCLWFIGGFTLGMLCIGFAENIQLLHRIYLRMNNDEIVNRNEIVYEEEIEQENETNEWYLPYEDREKIEHYYKNESILDIVPSMVEGYCIVKLMHGSTEYVRVVDVHGFGLREVDDEETKSAIIAWYNKQNSSDSQ